MSKHDTWIGIDNPYFKAIEHLFPDGIPARDPFPMLTKGDCLAGWVVDTKRLTQEQLRALVEAIVGKKIALVENALKRIENQSGLAIDHNNVCSIISGPEGFCRKIELLLFNEQHPDEDEATEQDWSQFISKQYERWIYGNQKPDIQAAYNSLPEHLKDGEMKLMHRNLLIEERIEQGGYSMEDLQSGDMLISILNEIDPENVYSKVDSFEITDDDRN